MTGEDCELVARIFVCPTTDAEPARQVGRRLIAAYLTVPVYAAFQAWLGRAEVLTPMHDAWAAGDRRGALAAIPDDLVDELVVHGHPEACRERVAEYRANGLDTPVVAIVPVPGGRARRHGAAACPPLTPRAAGPRRRRPAAHRRRPRSYAALL